MLDKCPVNSLPLMESFPNKWHCHQEGELQLPDLLVTISAVSRKRISRQAVYSRLAETGLYSARPFKSNSNLSEPWHVDLLQEEPRPSSIGAQIPKGGTEYFQRHC
ncbi:hypothetical protein TNCV_4400871 [Trichonephila clavipes]|nr:hypothetical protein TNCV_4400871 [Trichonephila clavipes]